MDDKVDETAIKLLIGAVSLVLLLITMGVLNFYSWVTTSLLSYVFSVFFVVPIALGIIQMRFPKEYIVLIIFGVGSLIVYAYFFDMTPQDIVADIIQTVAIITIFSALFSGIKTYVEKKIPP
ncbi:unnamed protein product [marine sediment metagenome]|uniref:Uncharacterized protein n=1 Tax=marine sediment metagenome TaxID=412755 RepID=X1CW89_9ZZZZ